MANAEGRKRLLAALDEAWRFEREIIKKERIKSDLEAERLVKSLASGVNQPTEQPVAVPVIGVPTQNSHALNARGNALKAPLSVPETVA